MLYKAQNTFHTLSFSYSAHLSLAVYSYDATSGLMHSSHKDGLPTDTVHVDAGASFQVVQMDIAKLGDQVHNVVLGAHLR